MLTLTRKKAGPQPQTQLERRVANIATPDLITWSENALYVLGKELTSYLRDHGSHHIDEAELGAEALLAITRELKRRSKNDF